MTLARQLLRWIDSRRRQGSTETLVKSFNGTVLFHRALKIEGAISKIATPSMEPFGTRGPLAVDLYLVAVVVEELLTELGDLRKEVEGHRRQVERRREENAWLNADNELLKIEVADLKERLKELQRSEEADSGDPT